MHVMNTAFRTLHVTIHARVSRKKLAEGVFIGNRRWGVYSNFMICKRSAYAERHAVEASQTGIHFTSLHLGVAQWY